MEGVGRAGAILSKISQNFIPAIRSKLFVEPDIFFGSDGPYQALGLEAA